MSDEKKDVKKEDVDFNKLKDKFILLLKQLIDVHETSSETCRTLGILALRELDDTWLRIARVILKQLSGEEINE